MKFWFSIKNIKIEDAKKYKIILKERKNDKYIEIDPIEINIETISENNEYILGNVSLKDNSREDVVLEKENNQIFKKTFHQESGVLILQNISEFQENIFYNQ